MRSADNYWDLDTKIMEPLVLFQQIV